MHQNRHETRYALQLAWRIIRIMDDHREADEYGTGRARRGGVHGIGA